ncbi:MAG: hypothetical protein RL313_750, partial [Actinomycetota bacterium]
MLSLPPAAIVENWLPGNQFKVLDFTAPTIFSMMSNQRTPIDIAL